MRRLITLITLAFLLIVLAACGGSSTPTPTQASTPTEEADTEDEAEAAEEEIEEESEEDEVDPALEGRGEVDTTQIAWTCPEGFEGQTLSVYNWATFIGETTISNFEALCGVRVIYDVYDSNETMIAALRTGNPGYDIGVPTDYATSIMIRDGLIQTINLEDIPNFANVIPMFTDQPFDPGNQYSVPYLWATTGIAYHTGRVGAEITSWRQLFEYDGPVAWLDDPRTMLSVALLLLGHDPNSVNPDEINAARDFLIANSGNVRAIAQDDGDTLLETGEVDIAVEYNGDIFQLGDRCGCDDFAYVIPVEGSIEDISNLVIFTGAPNPALAHVFLDFMLDPHVGAEVTNFTQYATINQRSIDLGLIDQALLDDPAITPNPETLENLFFFADVGAEGEQLYNDAWDEVKINIGG